MSPQPVWARVVLSAAMLSLAVCVTCWRRAFAEVLALAIRDACTASIGTAEVSEGTIVGRREDLLIILTGRGRVQYHDCLALLTKLPTGMTRAEWIIQKRATPVAENEVLALTRGHVRVQVTRPSEFLAVAKSTFSGSPPQGPPTASAGGRVAHPLPTQEKEGCEVESLCAHADGEVSYELKCGDLVFEVSTLGSFGIGVEGDSVAARWTIGGHPE